MKTRKKQALKLSLNEEEQDDANETSCDIGETTFRKGEFAIRRDGVELPATTNVDKEESLRAEDIEKIKLLGKGCSSQVYKVKDNRTNDFYALKILSNVYDKSKRDQLLTEIQTLYSIQCPWLVRCYGAYFKDNAIHVILEYCDEGSLDDVIKSAGPVPEHVLAAITFQLLKGLAYLKNRHQCHRDVKPQNILVDHTGYVKLTDFGLAKELEHSLQMANTFVGTFRYMSPERVQSLPYNTKIDIWSLGLILYECATGSRVYPQAKSHIDLVQTILDSPAPTLDKGEYSDDLREFLSCCLQKDPKKRLPPEILLGAPFLQNNGATDEESCIQSVQEWLNAL